MNEILNNLKYILKKWEKVMPIALKISFENDPLRQVMRSNAKAFQDNIKLRNFSEEFKRIEQTIIELEKREISEEDVRKDLEVWENEICRAYIVIIRYLIDEKEISEELNPKFFDSFNALKERVKNYEKVLLEEVERLFNDLKEIVNKKENQ